MHDEKAHREAIRSRFDAAAPDYDARSARFIDKYDEMIRVALEIAARLVPGATRFLDLGMGTGAVSERILDTLPGAAVHGVDFSEKMAERARAKLARFGDRFSCEIADLDGFDPVGGGPWDVVVSALAIHHLPDEGKRRLTLAIGRALRPGGLFLNADLVAGETALEQDTLTALHIEAMRARGIAEDEIQDRVRRHRENDTPARLSDQLAWLREAGCSEVWAPWRYLHQALMVGLRPGAPTR